MKSAAPQIEDVDLELVRSTRWNAIAMLGRDGRTIRAAEVRQLAAELRDACTLLLRLGGAA